MEAEFWCLEVPTLAYVKFLDPTKNIFEDFPFFHENPNKLKNSFLV